VKNFILRSKTTLQAITAILLVVIAPNVLLAADSADGAHHGLEGAGLSLLWIIPFVGILLSIAIFPLVAEHFWHKHFGKVSFFWAMSLVVPLIIFKGFDITLYEVMHVYLLEYFPFIILLFALFTISGGVRVKGTMIGSPIVNTGFLVLGTLLASWMGTTGAAMLLIRPLLRANEWRKRKVHIVVFFIFLVANVGGSLTPLGDPPLFIGFLKGVSFFWTTKNLLLEMAFVAAILITIFYLWDNYLYKSEENKPTAEADPNAEKFGLEGSVNLLLLVGVIGAVLFSGIAKIGEFHINGLHLSYANLVRDLALIGLAGLSWTLTSKDSRKLNGFNWFPIQEVGKLFAGIFITIIPAIAILKAGEDGKLAFVIDLVFNSDGSPNNTYFFWITGALSAFLDNAPTYLVFFQAAGGDAIHLMNDLTKTLVAISSGAVFMGAMTYIGNAPNFMVKAIAEDSGIVMPSFFGYMAWSIGILVPIFILVSMIFL
jgi:Na+/H+ antiporter NhaD/arsenite permease-like protein